MIIASVRVITVIKPFYFLLLIHEQWLSSITMQLSQFLLFSPFCLFNNVFGVYRHCRLSFPL